MRLTPDPLVEKLGRRMRAHLAAIPPAPDAPGTAVIDGLRALEAFTYEAPIESGGLDLGVTSGIVVATELGRRALPEVYGGVAFIADALRDRDGHDDLAAALAAGEAPVILAGLDSLSEIGGRSSHATRRGETAWELAGQVTLGRDPDESARFCMAVAADDGPLLVLLAPDVWRKRAVAVPGGWLTLDLDGLVVADGEIVGSLPGDRLSRARVRQAAYLLGLGEGACDLAAAYARNRRQFDRPLMEFQEIGFTLARAAIDLRAVRLSVGHAAWLADSGDGDDDFVIAAAGALAQAAEAALRVIRQALQIHGARGMTRDLPVHRFYELARLEVTRLGSPARLWREVGAHRLRSRATADVRGGEVLGQGSA